MRNAFIPSIAAQRCWQSLHDKKSGQKACRFLLSPNTPALSAPLSVTRARRPIRWAGIKVVELVRRQYGWNTIWVCEHKDVG